MCGWRNGFSQPPAETSISKSGFRLRSTAANISIRLDHFRSTLHLVLGVYTIIHSFHARQDGYWFITQQVTRFLFMSVNEQVKQNTTHQQHFDSHIAAEIPGIELAIPPSNSDEDAIQVVYTPATTTTSKGLVMLLHGCSHSSLELFSQSSTVLVVSISLKSWG